MENISKNEDNNSSKLGINGLGRIGKLTLWHHVARKYFDEIVINLERIHKLISATKELFVQEGLMDTKNISNLIVQQKTWMKNIMFWLFFGIFSFTAVFAFAALLIIFVSPERAEMYPQFTKFAWALCLAILFEVAVGIFALWRNLFRLPD